MLVQICWSDEVWLKLLTITNWLILPIGWEGWNVVWSDHIFYGTCWFRYQNFVIFGKQSEIPKHCFTCLMVIISTGHVSCQFHPGKFSCLTTGNNSWKRPEAARPTANRCLRASWQGIFKLFPEISLVRFLDCLLSLSRCSKEKVENNWATVKLQQWWI